jgi:hypothetical protein
VDFAPGAGLTDQLVVDVDLLLLHLQRAILSALSVAQGAQRPIGKMRDKIGTTLQSMGYISRGSDQSECA